jgi:Transcription factor WhiB
VIPNCHPSHPARKAEGMDLPMIEALVYSNLASKVERVKSWCESCPKRAECRRQGTWINEDGKRVFGEGIFGGLTQAERKAAGF